MRGVSKVFAIWPRWKTHGRCLSAAEAMDASPGVCLTLGLAM
jgi:hypothetical protein